MNCITKNIPNSVTCLNLLCGITAIIFASTPFDYTGALPHWQWSMIFIALASVADFADGFLARLLGAYSDLGKQLDSLSDNVSFGVAPSLLLFFILKAYPGYPDWAPWVALTIPVCGVLRLAKFNIDSRQSVDFIGMPIPANAIFWIGYCAMIAPAIEIMATGTPGVTLSPWSDALSNPFIIVPVIVVEAVMMICPLRMFSLKFKSYGLKENALRYILLVSTMALLIIFGLPGLTVAIILYVLLSLCYRKA